MSLLIAEINIEENLDSVFYLTHYRVYEFAIGGLLVWVNRKLVIHNVVREILFLFGLACIFYSGIYYSDKDVFPGAAALVPALGGR